LKKKEWGTRASVSPVKSVIIAKQDVVQTSNSAGKEMHRAGRITRNYFEAVMFNHCWEDFSVAAVDEEHT